MILVFIIFLLCRMITELILVLNMTFVSLILILLVIILVGVAHNTILIYVFSYILVFIVAHHASIFILLLDPWSLSESLLVCIWVVRYYFFKLYIVILCIFWWCLVLEFFILIRSLIILINISYKWLQTWLLLEAWVLFNIILFVLLLWMLVVFLIRILVYNLIVVSTVFLRVELFLKTRSVVKSSVIFILLYNSVLIFEILLV
jgi:hypothetical protein